MKYIIYVFGLILWSYSAYSSDIEDDEMPSYQVSYDDKTDQWSQGLKEIKTLEDLEHCFSAPQFGQNASWLASKFYGLEENTLIDDVEADEQTQSERFSSILPNGFSLFRIKPHLNYQDLLQLKQTGEIDTPAGIKFIFCARKPGNDDQCFDFFDCSMLNSLSEDVSAYCTVLPRCLVYSYGLFTLCGDRKVSDVSVEEYLPFFLDAIKSKKVSDLQGVQMQSGKDKELSYRQTYSSAAFCTFFRLYKGLEPFGVFSLVAIKIEAHDKASVIKELAPGLLNEVAKDIRKTQEYEHPDFSRFLNK